MSLFIKASDIPQLIKKGICNRYLLLPQSIPQILRGNAIKSACSAVNYKAKANGAFTLGESRGLGSIGSGMPRNVAPFLVARLRQFYPNDH